MKNMKAKEITVLIEILPDDIKFNRFGRIKTRLWNFVLPPHIRLKEK